MATTIYSGRIDQYFDEVDTIEWFIQFLETFESYDAVMAFEDQTKAGLPCKPHYHFVFKSKAKHDPMRRYMSSFLHLKGHLSQLKRAPCYDKAMCYILKQYPIQKYIPYSDLTEDVLNEYIQHSEEYNKTLKLNNWEAHYKEILATIKKNNKFDRYTIYNTIGLYIYKWNRKIYDSEEPELQKLIKQPAQLKSVVTAIEQQVLDEGAYMQMFAADNDYYIYKPEMAAYRSRKQLIKSYGYFIDDDDNMDDDDSTNIVQLYDD